MRYTEKLEALVFAISCIAANHLEHIVIGHDTASEHCWCEHGVAIRRLRNEIKTTQCAIDAVARRGKKASKLILRHTRMMTGPDGSSLECGNCGFIAYVKIDDGHCSCPGCDAGFKWEPESVACACPSHNAPTGCENPGCWKAVKR
jgi:hypothetical protein